MNILKNPGAVMVGCVLIILIVAALAVFPKVNLHIEGSICLGEICRARATPGPLGLGR